MQHDQRLLSQSADGAMKPPEDQVGGDNLSSF